MLESSSTVSKEYAINHVTTGMNRILKEPVVVQSNGKVSKIIVNKHHLWLIDRSNVELFYHSDSHIK